MKKTNSFKRLNILGSLSILLAAISLFAYYYTFSESYMIKFILPIAFFVVFFSLNGIGLLSRHYFLGFILGNLFSIFLILYFFIWIFLEKSHLSTILIRFFYPFILLLLINFRYKNSFTKFSIFKSNNLLHRYSFISFLTILLFLLVFPIYSHFQKDPYFLSSFRYKHVSDWIEIDKSFNFRIQTNREYDYSTSYLHTIYHNTCYEQIIINWNNDSIKVTKNSEDSTYHYNPNETFFSYDSNIIKIKEDNIIPVNEGSTVLYYKNPFGIDSIRLTVYQEDKKLIFKNENGLVDGLIQIKIQ